MIFLLGTLPLKQNIQRIKVPQEYNRKKKAEAYFPPEEELVSLEGIIHSSDKLFNHSAGDTPDM